MAGSDGGAIEGTHWSKSSKLSQGKPRCMRVIRQGGRRLINDEGLGGKDMSEGTNE